MYTRLRLYRQEGEGFVTRKAIPTAGHLAVSRPSTSVGFHSSRSARIGSTRGARCAGPHVASAVIVTSSAGMAAQAKGSMSSKVKNHSADVIARQANKLASRPAAAPAPPSVSYRTW